MKTKRLVVIALACLATALSQGNAPLAAEKCGSCAREGQRQPYLPQGYRPQPPRSGQSKESMEKKGRLLDTLRKAGSESVNLHQSQLTQEDSGRAKSVPLGDPLFIRLSGSPSTGCQWKVAELNGGSLRQDGAPVYYPRPEKRGGASSSGAYVFKFSTVKPGKTSLKLIYAKSGEKNKKPMNLFTATINVQSDPASNASASAGKASAEATPPRPKPPASASAQTKPRVAGR